LPKIKVTKNRIRIHVGNWWKKYKRNPDLFEEFRIHDVGREQKSERVSAKVKGKGWITYAWDFDKSQVEKVGKTLIVKDQKALEIIQKLKQQGELKGYKILIPVSKARKWKIHKRKIKGIEIV